jgi:hypothetical protein
MDKIIRDLLKNNNHYENFITKTIQPNRAYILNIQNTNVLYTIPRITPNKKGYFIITYYRENLKSLLLPLTNKYVDYILVNFEYKYFYLIPINKLPQRKDGSIKTGIRIYPKFLDLIYEDIFNEYLYEV